MSIEVKVYDNGDHTCLVWLPTDGKAIPNCRGFAVHRVCNGNEGYLHGFVGFSDTDKLDPANPWKFPVQRFMWWDYGVKPGDTVRYSIVPVTGPDKDHLSLDTEGASAQTEEMKITGQCTEHISAYFNKGIVASQWVSRELDAEPKGSKIKNLVATKGDVLRNALSGLLRPQILQLLEEAKTSGGQIYAALYELNDCELIPALEALGKNCNLILANGAFKDNTPANNDENKAVREQLKGKINVFNRIVTKGHFGHNKFVVFCDGAGKPQRVLTGSTNWTSSGLCTQANNGVIINDAGVAADYLAYWKRIKAAGNNYPKEYIEANSKASTHEVDGCKVTPWCVPTSDAQDLEFARGLINSAKDGILFLFFNPGTFQEDPKDWTLLQNILNRHHQEGNENYNPNLFLCGVVNQDIPMLTKEGGATKGKKPSDAALDPTAAQTPVTLFKNGIEPPLRLSHDVLVPHNIKEQFHEWEKELLGASMVNIHSKVIVCDPFGENPVVMTGSHNLGLKASSKNDDNLVIIQGNGALAAAYAINIVAIFQSYRWNAYVEAHRKDPANVWHGLVDNDQWQSGYLSGDGLAELKFWLGERAAVAAAAGGGAPAAAGGPRHVAKAASSRTTAHNGRHPGAGTTAPPKSAGQHRGQAGKKKS